MRGLRTFLRDHRRLAMGLAVLALALKALVPAGYMIGTGSRTLTIQICADASGQGIGQAMTRQIVVSTAGDHGNADGTAPAKASALCAFSALAFGALAPVDAVLLALVLAYIAALGLAPAAMLPPVRGNWLRPPLRGPPSLI